MKRKSPPWRWLLGHGAAIALGVLAGGLISLVVIYLILF